MQLLHFLVAMKHTAVARLPMENPSARYTASSAPIVNLHVSHPSSPALNAVRFDITVFNVLFIGFYKE
jgi:hypothetical protein